MDISASKYEIDDIKVGRRVVFEDTFAGEQIDRYAKLTGDISPIHVDAEFSAQRGYPDRVAHGMLVAGLFSRLVGVYLPGANALLQSANIKFHAPVFPGDLLEVCGEVSQVSHGAGIIIIAATVARKETGEKVASAKMQVGFTKVGG